MHLALKSKLWLTAFALVLVVAVAVANVHRGASVFKSGVFDPPQPAPAIELLGSNDAALSLRAHRGKVVAVAFGFSYCPRICPVTLAKLAEVKNRLGRSGSDLQVLFVTVDPERDSPSRLHEFLEFFDPSFLGGTGQPKELEALHRAYGVTADRVVSDDKKLGYEVHHSTSIYLIDRAGMLRLLFPFGKSADDLLHDVKRLLES
jgi:protein SCO1/2